jgi:hypothetical protein
VIAQRRDDPGVVGEVIDGTVDGVGWRALQEGGHASSIVDAFEVAPIVIDYNMSLAERAVPEWQATLDALQALPEIGVDAPSATAA